MSANLHTHIHKYTYNINFTFNDVVKKYNVIFNMNSSTNLAINFYKYKTISYNTLFLSFKYFYYIKY